MKQPIPKKTSQPSMGKVMISATNRMNQPSTNMGREKISMMSKRNQAAGPKTSPMVQLMIVSPMI